MKREFQKPPLHGPSPHDIKRDIAGAILSRIGAVSLAYNEAEGLIDGLLIRATGLDLGYLDIISRINGIEGKIEIIKAVFRELGAPNDVQEAVAVTLGMDGFLLYKQYRDAVTHARGLDLITKVASTVVKRGKRYEVLLTETALDALYKRLVMIRKEIFDLVVIAGELSTRHDANRFRKYAEQAEITIDLHHAHFSPQRTANIELNIRAGLAQYQQHLTLRRSLSPLPEFPTESELRLAHQRYFEAERTSPGSFFAALFPAASKSGDNGDK
jgi:hypothetical protein